MINIKLQLRNGLQINLTILINSLNKNVLHAYYVSCPLLDSG